MPQLLLSNLVLTWFINNCCLNTFDCKIVLWVAVHWWSTIIPRLYQNKWQYIHGRQCGNACIGSTQGIVKRSIGCIIITEATTLRKHHTKPLLSSQILYMVVDGIRGGPVLPGKMIERFAYRIETDNAFGAWFYPDATLAIFIQGR